MLTTDNHEVPQAAPKVSLDLDALDREGAPTEPFTANHLGRVYTFEDAQEIDWQKLMAALQNPRVFFQLTLGNDAKDFLGGQLPTWKLRRLMDAYRNHYGLLEPAEGNGSPG